MKYKPSQYIRIKPLLIICFLAFVNNSCGGKSLHFTCGFSEVSQTGINHLQPFIDAMEKYKVDNGKYPKLGTQLIPQYLDKIPVISSEKNVFDESQVKVLRNDKIWKDEATLAEDGSYFSLRFYPRDDRICLFGGRNNICEYTSESKQWGCYQH